MFGALAALIWAGFPAITKLSMASNALDAWDITALRFGVGGLLLLPLFARRRLGTLSPLTALFLAGPGMAQAASSGEATLSASLRGPVETPAGDPDGTGSFTARLNASHDQLCYTLTSAMIGAPTAAHIHTGKQGEAGPPVVPLQPQATDTCVAIDKAVADKILADPSSYYVNVHNAEYPRGAVRGQLTKG